MLVSTCTCKCEHFIDMAPVTDIIILLPDRGVQRIYHRIRIIIKIPQTSSVKGYGRLIMIVKIHVSQESFSLLIIAINVTNAVSEEKTVSMA